MKHGLNTDSEKSINGTNGFPGDAGNGGLGSGFIRAKAGGQRRGVWNSPGSARLNLPPPALARLGPPSPTSIFSEDGEEPKSQAELGTKAGRLRVQIFARKITGAGADLCGKVTEKSAKFHESPRKFA
jgi:hypothetical protein